MFFMYAALMIFLVSVDLLFFIVIATGIGIPVIIISQLITGCLGWMKIRKLDFNLFFYVEAEFQKGEPIVSEIWDELLLLLGACLLVYPGIITDVVGFPLLFGEIRAVVLDLFW